MIDEEWAVLDQEHTSVFIDAVRDPVFTELFDGPSHELWAYELPFFEGYSRYRLNNCEIYPYFSMDYISNGENHYYLDGSEHPIALLLKRDVLRLTADNILDYLDFFDDVVFDPARKVKFIVDAYDTGYAGASAMGHHFKAIGYTAQRKIEEFEGHFQLTIPVLFDGKTVQGSVRVDKNGKIFIEKPLFTPLLGRTYDSMQPLRYQQPNEQIIIEQNVEIIRKSASATRLMDMAASHGFEAKIISGITHNGITPNSKIGFVMAPYYISGYSPYQMLNLVAALRDCELQLLDFQRVKLPVKKGSDVSKDLSLNLDICLEMCNIIEELESAGHPEVLTCFRKMGLEPLYTGYKTGLDEIELLQIYGDILGVTEKKD